MAIHAAQLIVKVDADVAAADAKLKRTSDQVAGFGARISGASTSLLHFVTGMTAANLAASVIQGTLQELKYVTVDYNNFLEQTSIAFATMMGSAQRASDMLQKLQQFAVKTPFSFPELVDATRRLLAMGFAAEEVIPLLTDVGNAAAALGLGNQGIDRITLALGQMRAATKINAQDMRQLTEVGIPAWDILAKAIGKSVAETQKLASEGKIASSVFIEAFEQFSRQNYGGMMEKQSKTFAGAMSNIGDVVRNELGQATSGLYNVLRNAAVAVAGWLESQSQATAYIRQFKADLEKLHDAGYVNTETYRKLQGTIASLGFQYGMGIISAGEFKKKLEEAAAANADYTAAVERSKQVQAEANAVYDEAFVVVHRMAGAYKEAGQSLAEWTFRFQQADTAAKKAMLEERMAGLSESDQEQAEELWELRGQLAELTKQETDAMRELNLAQADGADRLRIYREERDKYTEGSAEWLYWQRRCVEEEKSLSRSYERSAAAAEKAAFSAGNLVSSLVALHPATRAAAAAVTGWEDAIRSVEQAIYNNQRAISREQDVLSGMQQHLSELNSSLSETQERLEDLSRPRLIGMSTMEMQINAVQAQLQRIDLAESLGVPLDEVVRQYPLLTQGAEEYLRTLPETRKELEKTLNQLRLVYDLRYQERLRLLEQTAQPPAEEVPYETALAGIVQAKRRIAELTNEISSQEQAISRQEAVVRDLQRSMDSLNDTLRAYQEHLAQAQRRQTLLNEALQLAYQWFIEDRQKLVELGGEASTQVAQVDQAAVMLLRSVSGFADDTTTVSEETLAGLVTSFKLSSALAVAEVSANLGKIPRDIFTTHHIVTVYESPFAAPVLPAVPGRQAGGEVSAGMPYIVGERGPELFIPRVSGAIVPSVPANLGDNINVTVTVHGSVISERDLAATIRTELLKLKHRNGTTGL